MTNGVFDPTKVMVATEKVKQLQVIEQNIALANEFNRTLGTPSHPRPHNPNEAEEMIPSAEARVSEVPPEPTFDLPPEVSRRNAARAKRRRNREKPTVVANKLPPPEEPMVAANPVAAEAPVLEFAEMGQQSGFFKRFKKTRQTLPEEIDITSPDAGTPELPPGSDFSMNGELGDGFATVEGELVPLDGSVLPGSVGGFDLPSSEGERRSGFLEMFRSPRSNRSHDVPDRPIPISIGSNSGNPYSGDFKASGGFSPLFDDPNKRNQMRDMTQAGSLPFGEGIAERLSLKEVGDLSQYLVVKSDTAFEPFKRGTEKVDPDNSFELYSGAVVKDLGISGLKRMIQVDSGETGLIKKFAARQLAVSEEVVMSNGLARGRPWYSILDTEAEYDEFAANLSSRPAAMGSGPQRPWDPTREKLENGKPDSDLSQYYIVKRSGVSFGPFADESQKVDTASSFDMPTGSIVKIMSTPGSNHIVETDSGENGLIPVNGLRPMNESEQAQLAQGISGGRPWYSILDTAADVVPFSAARKPAGPTMGGQKPPKPAAKKPKVIPSKPDNDIEQYYVVTKEGTLFEPFQEGSQLPDADLSFEMYKGALVKVLTTLNGKHVVQSDSGESGAMAVSGLRPLSSAEKEKMASGISNGKAWYSILDTDAE